MLVKLARGGDAEAFRQLAARYRRVALGIIRQWAVRDEAEDVLQDVMALAWAKLPGLAEAQAFPAWFRILTTNLCRRHCRRRERRQWVSLDEETHGVLLQQADPLDLFLRREQSERLREALLALPADNRQALILACWAHYSYVEIAARLGIPLTTVEGRIHRARRQIRQLLGLPGREPARRTHAGGHVMQKQPILVPQLGHSRTPNVLTVSPDGSRLLSTVSGDTILWNLVSGDAVRRFKLPGGPMRVKFTPDGTCAVSVSWYDSTICWNLEADRQEFALPVDARDFDFSPDGRYLWTTSFTPDPEQQRWVRTNVLCWDTTNRKVVQRLENLEGYPSLLSVSRGIVVTEAGTPVFDEQTLTHVAETQLLVWDLSGSGERARLQGLPGHAHAIALAPSGELLAAATQDAGMPNDILLWDTRTGELRQRLAGIHAQVAELQFTPDGGTLVAGTFAGEVACWRTADGQLLEAFSAGARVEALALVNAGTEAIVSAATQQTLYWLAGDMTRRSLSDGAVRHHFPAHTRDIISAAADAQGRQLAVGGFDTAIALWNLQEGGITRTIPTPAGAYVKGLHFHPTLPQLIGAVSTIPDPSVALRDSRQQGVGTIMVWSLETGEPLHELREQHGTLGDFAIAPDGQYATSSAMDGSLLIWDAVRWQVRHRLQAPQGWLGAAAVRFASGGALLAANSALLDAYGGVKQGALTICDVDSGEVVQRWQTDGRIYDAPAFSADGTLIYAAFPLRAGLDSTLEVLGWEVGSGRQVRRYTAPADLGSIIAINPDPAGLTLTAGTGLGAIVCWDAESGAILHVTQRSSWNNFMLPLPTHPHMMIIGGVNGEVEIRAMDGSGAVTLMAIDNGAQWLAYTPDGHYDCSPGTEQYLRWRVDGQLYPVERFAGEYQQAGIVGNLWKG